MAGFVLGSRLLDHRIGFVDPHLRRHSSLGRSHLRRLFLDLSRVDDEFERVSILVLLHQLEV